MTENQRERPARPDTPLPGTSARGADAAAAVGPDDAARLLHATLAGTAAVTGPAFFDRAVEVLAGAFEVHMAFVSVPIAHRAGWNRTVARWMGDGPAPQVEYRTAGTPCAEIDDAVLVLHSHDVQSAFPDDTWLRDAGIESYLACRLPSSDGRLIGHVALLDTGPCELDENELASLRIFSSRIGAEVERRRADADAVQMQEFRSRIHGFGPFGLAHLDLLTDQGESNDRFAEIVGRSLSECRSLGWETVIHPEDMTRFGTLVDDLTTGKSVVDTEIRVVRPDGGVRWVQAFGTALLDASARPLEFTVFLLDKTDEHHVREALVTQAAILQRHRAELEGTLRAFSDLRFRIADDGTYLNIWASDPSMLAARPEEMIGTNIAAYFPPWLTKRFLDAIHRTSTTSEISSVEYHTHDGDLNRYFEVRFTPIRTGEAMALVRDISELKSLEAQLVHAGTMQSIGRLAGGVAHDFNNILHVINGHAAALRRDLDDRETMNRRIDSIIHAVERTSSLVDRLMSISRPAPDEPSPTAVDEFLATLSPGLSQLLGERIELELDLHAPSVAVVIDESRFENAILNLITNAKDAMPNGGSLRITTRHDDQSVVIDVADTGEGIDAAIAAQVFEPFFTTKRPGIGTGLGLATSFHSITAAGGTLTLSSPSGVGTTFTIELPIAFLGDAVSEPVSTPNQRPVRRSTVLVVEDETDVLELCADSLAAMGYEVLTACDADAALTLVDAEAIQFDAMITDVVMPGMSGLELAELVRARRPGLPIVFMSGYAADGSLDRPGLESAPFLRKPFSDDALHDAMSVVLGPGHELR